MQRARERHCECTDDGGGTLVAFLVGHWTLTEEGLVVKDTLISCPHPPPLTIHLPTLILGHRETGRFNTLNASVLYANGFRYLI